MEIAIFFMLGMLLVTVAILVVAVINGMSRISKIEKEHTGSQLMNDNSISHIHRMMDDERRNFYEQFNQMDRVLDERFNSVDHQMSNLKSATDSRFDKSNSYVDTQINKLNLYLDNQIGRLESNITTTEVANKMKKQQING